MKRTLLAHGSVVVFLFFVFLLPSVIGANVKLRGEKRQWHKVTLVFSGAQRWREGSPRTFSNYRLDVTFTAGSDSWKVAGYFAGDGSAAYSGASSGSTWECNFSPPVTGLISWVAQFREGDNVAINGGGRPLGPLDGLRGDFVVRESDKTGRDHRGEGRLQYVGKRYLQYSGSRKYFLKTGADSPENFLAYADFDNTGDYRGLRKTYPRHIGDWKAGDPVWKRSKGKGIIGALNYQSRMGMNVQSFLSMNVAGDDRNVYPYITNTSYTTFDISKMAQWEIVFEHMDKVGMYIHFKLMETENQSLLSRSERNLYYREMVARFGHHLALNWNVGEESTIPALDRRDRANEIASLDPYSNHVVVHSKPRLQELVYGPILKDIKRGIRTSFTGASLQTGNQADVHSETVFWVKKSEEAGRPWVVASDETGPATEGVPPDNRSRDNHRADRANILYGNLMGGGGGCESYFGYRFHESDLTMEDFRSREEWWKQSLIAREFFQKFTRFWQMDPADVLVSGGAWALAKPGSSYVIYLRNGGTTTIDLRDQRRDYKVKWFNAEKGGRLRTQRSGVTCIRGGGRRSIGDAPSRSDWIALLTVGCA